MKFYKEKDINVEIFLPEVGIYQGLLSSYEISVMLNIFARSRKQYSLCRKTVQVNSQKENLFLAGD